MRRVRCGAVLLPSRLLPSSSAASVWRRFLPPRVRCRALTFHTSPSCSARLPRRTILFSFLRPQHQRATLASAILLPSVCCRLPCVLAACICVRARAPRIFLHPHPPFRVHSPCFLHPDGARSLPPVPSRVPGGPCRKLCCVLPWACHCHSAPLFLSPFVRYIVWSADAYLRTVCERRTPRHPTSGCACHCAAFVCAAWCAARAGCGWGPGAGLDTRGAGSCSRSRVSALRMAEKLSNHACKNKSHAKPRPPVSLDTL